MSNIPESIKKLIQSNDPAIHHLDLSNRGLNDDDVSELQELLQQKNKYITSINLANNNITFNGCQILSLLATIKKIDLSHCSIGDKGIAALVDSKIEDLDVSYCGITEEGANLLKKNLNKYTSLELIGNPAISAETLKHIRRNFIGSPSIYPSPIGLDLGLNIHSAYESESLFSGSGFEVKSFEKTPAPDFQGITAPTSPEQVLADKLIKDHQEIQHFSSAEKEKLILHFSKCLGINVEIKPGQSSPTLSPKAILKAQ